MLQINHLTLTHKKDLRIILNDFDLVLNDGDKAALIGEEGNGKSTLIKWIYEPALVDDYIEYSGSRSFGGERLAYLPQELAERDKQKSVYEYFSESECFFDASPKELAGLSKDFHVGVDFAYGDQLMGSLSGGEKIKAQLMRLILTEPTVLLLDEPSNDIDIETLEWLEDFINGWKHIVLFISHDETLIENTANMIVHLEQIRRKTISRYTVARLPYRQYIDERLNSFRHQRQQAISDLREKRIRDEKFRRISQSVESAQNSVSRGDPSTGRLLKKKMHTVRAMSRRFEREDENMTQMPETEYPIFFRLGTASTEVPAGKTVIEYDLPILYTPDGRRELAHSIHIRVKGAEKVCIIGANGAGKTTLIKRIAQELLARHDICVEYMPQDYEELLDFSMTPVEFLAKTGDKDELTMIRTYLGSLKYTIDEMEHPISELSGGQRAKVLLLKMNLSCANVLILDEPTRNFSPLSGPMIRKVIRDFPGAVISISHDRKYIGEVCDKVYRLTASGLEEVDLRE